MALTPPPQTRPPEKTAEAHRFDEGALARLEVWLGENVPGCRGGTAVARQFIAPSLDLSVQFHRLADLGEWLLCSGESGIAERGLVGFRSGVWTEDGRLAASGSGQLLCRRVPQPAASD